MRLRAIGGGGGGGGAVLDYAPIGHAQAAPKDAVTDARDAWERAQWERSRAVAAASADARFAYAEGPLARRQELLPRHDWAEPAGASKRRTFSHSPLPPISYFSPAVCRVELWTQPLTVRAIVVRTCGVLGSVDTQEAGSETGTEETVASVASRLSSSGAATAATRRTTVVRMRPSIIDTAATHWHTVEHRTTGAIRPSRATAAAARRGMRQGAPTQRCRAVAVRLHGITTTTLRVAVLEAHPAAAVVAASPHASDGTPRSTAAALRRRLPAAVNASRQP